MRFFAVIVACVFTTSFLEARVITWKDATELTEKNSPELRAAIATYNSVKALELGAASGFYPRLSAKVGGNQSGAPGSATTFGYSAGLALSQNLFAGFSDYYSYQLKKINSEQALVDLKIIKSRLSQELKQTFAEAYYSQQNVKLSEGILKRRQENIRSVQLQYDVGRENKGSLLLSQANIESAEFDLLKARNDNEVVTENFLRQLGLPNNEVIVIENNIAFQPLESKPDFIKLSENQLQVLKVRNEGLIATYNSDVS
jgi:outer membrane protein